MGTRVAPTFANLFMGSLEHFILNVSGNRLVSRIYKTFWKRFIDDIFLLWSGTESEFEEFMVFLNSCHSNIKFTATYDFKTKSVPFLDVLVTVKEGEIITDLYRKPSSTVQYLLPTSCHPGHITRNIPYSLGYRIIRICSNTQTMLQRLQELREMLLSRQYSPNIIESAFTRLKNIKREDALKRVVRVKRPPKLTFSCKYDPRLPNINSIIKKHFAVMSEDPYLGRVFASGCQVAYSRNRNLKDIICRARLYPTISSRPRRERLGWHKCNSCITCTHSRNMTSFKSYATGEIINISQNLTCTDTNVIYCIQCDKCGMQYIGKTKNQFRTRMIQHRNSIGSSTSSVALHFEKKGHSSHNFICFAIEKVLGDCFVLAARERFYIDRLDVVAKGMNSNRT